MSETGAKKGRPAGIRNNEGKSQPSMKRLGPRHHEMARRLMEGERPRKIAEAFNMTLANFRYIYRSPLFQAKLAELTAAADAETLADRRKLRELTPGALALVKATMEGDSELLEVSDSQRLDTAWKVLDRTVPAEPGTPKAAKDAPGGAPAQVLAQEGATVNIYQERDPVALERRFQELLRSLEGGE